MAVVEGIARWWAAAAAAGILVACAGGCGAGAQPGADDGAGGTWFVEITGAAGIDFRHVSGKRMGFHMPEIMGAGAALFDCDGDGDLDIYLVNGNDLFDPDPEIVNRLYRHDPGGRFTDVTAESGAGDPGYGMGVAVGDVDNDGDADLYVTNYGPDRLYLNRGDGRFEDATAAAGIEVDGWSCSAAFFDYDRDGFLDLYVTRYVRWHEKPCFDRAGRPDYCGPRAYPPATDVLLHNEGDGTFTDVTGASGIGSAAAAGLGVVCEDFNEDGRPDVYVANDAYANFLWLNRGDGTFRDAAIEYGCAYNLHGQAEAGMGVVAADFDNDGLHDLFVTHLAEESNTLYRSLGTGGFSDATGPSGLGTTSMPWTGFGTAALDADLDGDLDLVVANGRVQRGTPLDGAGVPPPWDLFAEPNLLYVNTGAGGFRPAGKRAPALCDPIEISRGLAAGDLDDDGDPDLLLTNTEGPARLYRNDAPRRGHWLVVRAVDPRLGRDAIGARVSVVCGDRRFLRTITRGGSYVSSGDPRAYFGLGEARRVDAVEVRWPDGLIERFDGGAADRSLVLRRGSGEALP